ncbi:MAG: molecular chaperone DnaJ [Gemmatimonadetes bacterium]|nr:molecular chaperone DnaJ [Gemmatimonadota bacterium]
MTDYYQLLGVARDASAEEIKKAYRQVALKHHPDRNEGSKESEERFKEVTRAYEVLRDPDQRSVYDRYGEQGLARGAGSTQGFDFTDALDVFMRDFGGGLGGLGDLFGRQRRGPQGPERGQSLKVRLRLSLQEVVTGAKHTLKVQVLDPCERCSGSGAEDGTSARTCATCGGTGEERLVQRSAFGQLVSVQPCRACRGQGQVIDTPCKRCHGEGRERGESEVEVEAPPGVSSENYITLRGRGSAGPRGGPRGDLIVLLDVEEDPRFVREGTQLLFELPVTVGQAALGDEIEVPTVEGTAWLRVPAGTQSGELLRVRGQGLPELGTTRRGDQIVRIVVWVPDRLSAEQERIYLQLKAIEDPAPERIADADRKGFWSRVKEAFRAG